MKGSYCLCSFISILTAKMWALSGPILSLDTILANGTPGVLLKMYICLLSFKKILFIKYWFPEGFCLFVCFTVDFTHHCFNPGSQRDDWHSMLWNVYLFCLLSPHTSARTADHFLFGNSIKNAFSTLFSMDPPLFCFSDHFLFFFLQQLFEY